MTTEFIDLYCERTAYGLWNEPLNTLSNLSFPLAALVATVMISCRGRTDLPEVVVVALAALIGIGSALFHMFANHATELMDVIPIWSFVACYSVLAVYRQTGQDKRRTFRIAVIGLAIGVGVFWTTSGDATTGATNKVGAFNGSVQYAPALAALVIFAALSMAKGFAGWRWIAVAAGTFALSLVFRTIDLQVCAALPIGTHYLWHLLNGAMVGFLLVALVRHMPPLHR